MELLIQQRQFFATGVTKSLGFREQTLKKLRKVIESRQEAIFRALKSDLGKPDAEIFMTEFGFVLQDLEHTLKNFKIWAEPKEVSTGIASMPAKSYVLREPLGTALILSPWNYPFQLAMSPMIAAIAAGNTVVLKPSEFTPATSQLLAEMIKVSFSSEYIHVVEGGPDVSAELLKQRWDKIFFTGSTRVGKIVALAAAEHLTPTTLELGGKSPAFVLADADISTAAKRLVWGKFVNAGQTCVAPDYLLVDKTIKDKLVTAIKKVLGEFYPQGPVPEENYTRIVSESHFNRLVDLMKGAKVIHGGEWDKARRLIVPTVLDQVNWESAVMQEEIFGPIWPILEFDQLDTAIANVKAQEKPLALYVFTGDAKKKEKILGAISFGGGTVNDTLMHLSNPDLPFGGVGQSGTGAYHGEVGFLCFSHEKSIMERAMWMDPNLRYPPYTEGKLKWIKRFL